MNKLLQNIVKYYKAYVAYRNAVKELSSLSDHELQDIGISRCEIDNIAKQSCRDQLVTA
jgi:uncharacterized protein YjiS (DUF1127 family)